MSAEGQMRIGDRDRQQVQDHLRDAYGQGALSTDEFEERLEIAMQARTRAEIEPLVHDLPVPVPPGAPPAPQSTAPRPPSGVGGKAVGWLAAAAAVVAIGLGITAADSISIFGSSQRTLGPGQELTVFSMFGSTEVVVPDGTAAENEVIAIFGSSECADVCTGAPDDDDVRVNGFVLFGSVEIHDATEADR